MRLRRRIFIDLDGTLCLGNKEDTAKECINCKPIKKFIKIIKIFKELNFKIIIHTARPERLRKVTLKWLENNNIIFDDLKMDKNKWDLYIGDKCKSVFDTEDIRDLLYNILLSREDRDE